MCIFKKSICTKQPTHLIILTFDKMNIPSNCFKKNTLAFMGELAYFLLKGFSLQAHRSPRTYPVKLTWAHTSGVPGSQLSQALEHVSFFSPCSNTVIWDTYRNNRGLGTLNLSSTFIFVLHFRIGFYLIL